MAPWIPWTMALRACWWTPDQPPGANIWRALLEGAAVRRYASMPSGLSGGGGLAISLRPAFYRQPR